MNYITLTSSTLERPIHIRRDLIAVVSSSKDFKLTYLKLNTLTQVDLAVTESVEEVLKLLTPEISKED